MSEHSTASSNYSVLGRRSPNLWISTKVCRLGAQCPLSTISSWIFCLADMAPAPYFIAYSQEQDTGCLRPCMDLSPCRDEDMKLLRRTWQLAQITGRSEHGGNVNPVEGAIGH